MKISPEFSDRNLCENFSAEVEIHYIGTSFSIASLSICGGDCRISLTASPIK
jgi:hypothetical protein